MQFEWDERKRKSNLAKHGVDFADAVGVFDDDRARTQPDPDSEGEAISVTVGMSLKVEVVLVVWTQRTEDIIRLISARKASPGEISKY